MSATSVDPASDPVRLAYDQAYQSLKAGDAEQAEHLCRRAAVRFERNPNILSLLGEICLRRNRPQEGRSWFRKVLDLLPDNPRALEGIGKAFLAEKRPERAIKYLQNVLSLMPDRVPARLALGRALAMAGRPDEAEAAIKRALDLDPARAALARAAEALSAGQAEAAEQILRRQLALQPDDPAILRLLAQIALDAGRRKPALRLLQRCVAIAPDFALAWNNLADVYLKEDRYPEAMQAVEQAIQLHPESPHSRVIKGNILARAQRSDEALAAFDEALQLSPAYSGALSARGHVLKTIGRTPEAIATYRKCISLHPAYGEPYWSLANLKTFSFEPDEVERLREILKRESLTEDSRANMLYALAKHEENQQCFDEAFGLYKRGAAIRRSQEYYDPVQNQLVHQRNREVFSADFFSQRTGWGAAGREPILIVGLPRSGSTLIEQILASHSQVEGTMELPDLGRRIREVSAARRDQVEYPEAVADLDQTEVEALGQRYLDTTMRYRTGKPHFIDKMPNNFSNLGFLHLILPQARVINIRRHPLDSCLGSYKQLFYNGQAFTYDFFELGQYYLQYQQMMDYWHEQLPGVILDVHYEDLILQQETQTRRMLEFLGLEFEPQCLQFWKTARPIHTASSEQVRKPLYRSGINFWRNYESHLQELIQVLKPLLLELPETDRPRSMQ